VNAGRAYVFDSRSGALVAQLANPTPAAADNFGSTVAVSKNLAVIGAMNDDTANTDQGAAYSFLLNQETWTSPSGFQFDIDGAAKHAGQLIHGSNNAFDGLNRLRISNIDYSPASNLASVSDDDGRTLVTPTVTMSIINVAREITVPDTGNQDFARTITVLTNPATSPITSAIPVRMLGNLGSDGTTTVFATSDGDTIVETSDWWIGTGYSCCSQSTRVRAHKSNTGRRQHRMDL
jgi:hypothetical protein